MTPERRAEIERLINSYNGESSSHGADGTAVWFMQDGCPEELLAEIDRLTAENARLTKVVDQLLDIIETHYDDNMGVDATDSSIVWGIEWEDDAQCVWTDEEKPELAAELEARSR